MHVKCGSSMDNLEAMYIKAHFGIPHLSIQNVPKCSRKNSSKHGD
jgi:hypothetical protein